MASGKQATGVGRGLLEIEGWTRDALEPRMMDEWRAIYRLQGREGCKLFAYEDKARTIDPATGEIVKKHKGWSWGWGHLGTGKELNEEDRKVFLQIKVEHMAQEYARRDPEGGTLTAADRAWLADHIVRTMEFKKKLEDEDNKPRKERAPNYRMTLGYDTDLERDGIPLWAADYFLRKDFAEFKEKARQLIPGFDEMSGIRKEVAVDLEYNVGPDKLRKFAKMNQALEERDFRVAARELLWNGPGKPTPYAVATQIRAFTNAYMLEFGKEWPGELQTDAGKERLRSFMSFEAIARRDPEAHVREFSFGSPSAP